MLFRYCGFDNLPPAGIDANTNYLDALIEVLSR
jgi:hypothetical protein